ncbi:hypothetical protein Taro_008031 [Colocasia esculenta]|uniref:CCHC-type domain-containing protein n=1 Tax=Colocasia esculenta TaxID=4460 RepID=A0A843TX50_COLES|nr:hypothetical protein [Colocasia esculenta]
MVSMAPRRRPREGVAVQVTRQEVGDAPPPQQTQPLPQDAHSGIVPPPPPQVAQGLDMTRFLEGMAQFVAQHRDAPVPQGGTGRTQALTWWSAEWETTFQSRPLRQIPWQEFVISFERAFCPTYVRTERLYQFLDLQQRDSTVVQYRARFVELGRYAPQIMGDEGLRTQQFVRGLTPELRQALIVARVTDLDAAYQTAAALEADTLRTRARSAEVQTQVVPSQPRQQQGSVQMTPRTTTSYASTSTRTMAKSGSQRKFRRDRRQVEQRQQSVGSVQQPTGQPSQQVHRTFARQCYRCDQMGHMARDCPLLPRVPQQQTQSQPRVQQQQQQQAPLLLGDLSSWEGPGSCGVARSGGKRVVGLRRLPFQASLATLVLVLPSCSELYPFVVLLNSVLCSDSEVVYDMFI